MLACMCDRPRYTYNDFIPTFERRTPRSIIIIPSLTLDLYEIISRVKAPEKNSGGVCEDSTAAITAERGEKVFGLSFVLPLSVASTADKSLALAGISFLRRNPRSYHF